MSRPLRIEYPGAFYHVINRGIERRVIYSETADFQYFLSTIKALYHRYRIRLFAYCLMPNHYHLFLNTPKGRLGSFMRELNSQYGQYYNKRRHRIGPVFQGRYKAVLVDKETHGLAISRYIHMNPVLASLAERPDEYRWSSYPALIGKVQSESYLDTGWLVGQFSPDKQRGRKLLREFTEGETEKENELKESEAIAGGKGFMDWVKREHVPRERDGGISGLRELQKPPALVKEAIEGRIGQIVRDGRLRRKALIYALHRGTTLTAREIAALVGAKSGSAVAQTVRRIRVARQSDRQLETLMSKVDLVCRG